MSMYKFPSTILILGCGLMLLSGKNVVTQPASTTVITVTVGTDVATGTYELETLTQYASLREHITMMTTMTGTATTSGDSGLETIAAVVLAGGVAWFLAGKLHSASQ